MSKENFRQRLLTTILFPPLLFVIIYFLPYCYHLAFALVVVVVDLIASYEMQRMIFPRGETGEASGKGSGPDKPLIPFWVPGILPIVEYFDLIYDSSFPISEIVFVAMILISFAKEVFRGAEDEVPFSGSLHRIAHTVLLIIYPSYLSTYMIRLTVEPENATFVLLFLFLLVFSNDIFCYVFGMLFGKSTRGIVKASPNKSLVGYLGGMAVTTVISYFYVKHVPGMSALIPNVAASIALGITMAIAGDIGDLIESAFKRAAGVKDSGTIIPGRGGILDSVDSLFSCAPVLCLFIYRIPALA